MLTQAEKGRAFRSLHERERAFIIPNPWDAGTARLLAHLGFEALATTSMGYASSSGKADHTIGRAETMAHIAAIAQATDLAVSADLENGFDDSPDAVAETIVLAASAGAVGGSIEDATGRPDDPIYDKEHAAERILAAAEAAHEPNPIATVNPKCKHCSGRHACETYQRTALEAADLSMRSVPLDLTPQALGLELSMLKRAQAALDGRISGLEQSVEAAVKQGQRVPGWSIEYTNGRQAWMVPTDEVVALGEMMQVDLSKKAVVTPKQAVKAGLDPALVDAYSFFPPGSPKLVPDNLSILRKVFQK